MAEGLREVKNGQNQPDGPIRQPSVGSYARLMDVRALGDLTLLDADGNPHRIGDLWRDRPVVLVFLRHFG